MIVNRIDVNRVSQWLYTNENKTKAHLKFWDFLDTGKNYFGSAKMELTEELEEDFSRVKAILDEQDNKRAEEIRKINLMKSRKK